jgi:hypothetical protein
VHWFKSFIHFVLLATTPTYFRQGVTNCATLSNIIKILFWQSMAAKYLHVIEGLECFKHDGPEPQVWREQLLPEGPPAWHFVL